MSLLSRRLSERTEADLDTTYCPDCEAVYLEIKYEGWSLVGRRFVQAEQKTKGDCGVWLPKGLELSLMENQKQPPKASILRSGNDLR